MDRLFINVEGVEIETFLYRWPAVGFDNRAVGAPEVVLDVPHERPNKGVAVLDLGVGVVARVPGNPNTIDALAGQCQYVADHSYCGRVMGKPIGDLFGVGFHPAGVELAEHQVDAF